MKPLKTILTVFFICKALLANSQHKVSGILILSGSRDHMSFDLFVPGNIYKTKTLATNLVNLSDTAIRFGTYEGNLLKNSMLKRAVKLVNETKIKGAETYKDVLVLAVVLEYDDDDVVKSVPGEFYEYEVILLGQPIVKPYNNKKPFFKKLKVLSLPKDSAANTSYVN